jgi:hypothetical protein
MPSAKLSGQIQGTTTANTMPASSSLQDISSHTHKFNWNKDQPSINLPESLLTSKNGTNNRHKNISHSDDRIFEHPEVTIKPSILDEKVHRRLMMTTKTSTTNEKSGGSVPNILEHPDIRTPIVMETEQLSSSSSSSSESSSSSGDKKKLFRQQSADVYSTLARTTPPTNQTNLVTNLIRSNSPGSLIGGIVESPEQEKSEDSPSSSPPPTNKGPVQIIREYSRASSTSDIDPTGKHSNNKPQSEEDDFW